MNATRFSHSLALGTMSAALLAGCSAGSQFAPPTGSTGSNPAPVQQVAFQQAAPAHAARAGRQHGVSPAWVDYTGAVLINGKLHWYYINIWNQWIWIPSTIKGKGGSGGSGLGGSLASTKQADMATTAATVEVFAGKKLVNTLSGLNGAATGVETDSRGNTFAAMNAGSGGAVVDEFQVGSDTPTATFSDSNLQSVDTLAVDKADRVYVEGQSQSGGIEVDEMTTGGAFEPLAQSGALGSTSGGMAVQMSGKTTYLWINDLGNSGEPANIARYELTGSSLVKQSSFQYAGINGAIVVDPSGKDTKHVYAVNNVAAGSQYSVSGIEYAYPSGQIVSQSPTQTASQESNGIMLR